jgi:hypothetical protein
VTESAGGLAAALVAALGELCDVPKSGLVKMQGRPDRSYPTLADVHQVERPVLARHGLAVLQDVVTDGDWVHVTTHIVHVSGEERRHGPISRPAGRDVQQLGSEITYCRRYGLMAALGLAGVEEDDDGGGGVPVRTVSPARAARGGTPPPPDVDVPVPPHPRGRARDGTPPPGGSGVPSGSAQARAARAAVARAEEWRARVRALPAGDVRARAAKVFTDEGATPGVELDATQAVVILGKLKRHEPRIVLAERERDEPPDEEPELFDDGPPLDGLEDAVPPDD